MLSPKIKYLTRLQKFNVPKFKYYSVSNWLKNKDIILKKIKKNFNKKIAIRSASLDEDNLYSNAGKYKSFLNINPKNSKIVSEIIDEVISSYNSKIKLESSFIIQKMISKPKINGVIFTQDPNSGFPRTIINYTKTKETDLITSGQVSGNQIIYFNHKKTKINVKYINKLRRNIENIVKFIGKKNLDIEFCIDNHDKFILLQCRLLKINKVKKYDLNELYKNYFFFYRKLNKILPSDHILNGKKTFFSTMTDWNPAEMIGLKPKKLTYTLYQELISNEVWSESRKELGYKNVLGAPLIKIFLGTPYVDIKTDFNSFLNDKLDNRIQKKLINYYLSEFSKNPYYYFDKVESKLVLNCINFSSDKIISELKRKINLTSHNVSKIKGSYLDITNGLKDKLESEIKKYKKLDLEIDRIAKDNKTHSINKIYNLIIIVKKYGTLPFSNLARMAFVSVSFLDSMIDRKIITESDKFKIMNSNLNFSKKSINLLSKGKKREFLKTFGHLRPSTYDITTDNYKDGYKLYFKSYPNKKNNPQVRKKFIFSKNQKMLISKELKKNKLKFTFKTLLDFIFKSINSREESKRVFSKGINQIFNEIKKLSKTTKISVEDFSHLDIQILKNLYNNFDTNHIKYTFRRDIEINKKNYKKNLLFQLPDVIINSKDIFFYDEKVKKGNYLGFSEIIKKPILINSTTKNYDLDNKIVCIENADPGYDFIFSKKIAGLITAYGGPNSHMCIRCNELNIPACIGAGKNMFNKVINARLIVLSCDKKKIEVIK